MTGKRSYFPPTAVLALITISVALIIDARAATERVLHTFAIQPNGDVPTGPVTADLEGNLYGGTAWGGFLDCPGSQGAGCGVIFALRPNPTGGWDESVLYRFNGADGASPNGGMVFDAAGNLYGTTYYGGTGPCTDGYQPGCGVIFKLTPNPSATEWRESVLYNFGGGSDGAHPDSGLIFDSAGNLYGVTGYGGGGSCSDPFGVGCGSVFDLTPSGNGSLWKENVLHTFRVADGAYPTGPLIFDDAGNLYGTTWYGGRFGFGTVFELMNSEGQWQERLLHSFTNGQDGANPAAGLIADSNGNFFGTAAYGGLQVCYDDAGEVFGCGTAFTFRQGPNGNWNTRVIHSFTGGADGQGGDDGAVPSGLTLDVAGNLYGDTTLGGNVSGAGMVFELTRGLGVGGQWTETVLHSFGGAQDGYEPRFTPLLTGAGDLFGTTQEGGTNNQGTVFEVTP